MITSAFRASSRFRRLALWICLSLVAVSPPGIVSAGVDPCALQSTALDEAESLATQAVELSNKGRYGEAIPLAERALAIVEKALGPDHPDMADYLNILARLNHMAGAYPKAEPLYLRTLAIREKALGPEDPATANALDDLATLYWMTGAPAKSEPLAQRALAIREKVLGPEHLDVARSLTTLGGIYRSMGAIAKMEPLLLRALAIREKARGPEHPEVAESFNNLAVYYRSIGAYAKAEPLYLKATAIYEKAYGPDHPDVAQSVNNVASLYQITGSYTKAERFYLKALAIREKALGPDHPDVGLTLGNLGSLYRVTGDFAKAEPILVRSVAIREKTLGPDHPDLAFSLVMLGNVYLSLKAYAKVEPLLLRSLAIREKALGPNHERVAESLNDLGVLYRSSGDYAKAEASFLRAIRILETIESLPYGPAFLLASLADLYREMGDDQAKAEPLYTRALALEEKAFGSDHPQVAVTLSDLASTYQSLGKYEKAEPLYLKALAVREKALGPGHPSTARALGTIAGFYREIADPTRAVGFQIRANDAQEKDFVRNLGFGSERQKLQFLSGTTSGLEQTLSLDASLAPGTPLAREMALEMVLRRKGRALDVMTRQIEGLRERAASEEARLLEDLAAARAVLASLTLSGPGKASVESHRARLDELSAKVDDLENQVSGRSQQFAVEIHPVALSEVRAHIPEGARLVEYVVYRPMDPKTRKPGAPRYAVYVAGREGPVVSADLGEAEAVDALVAEFRKRLRTSRSKLDTELRPLARRLDASVMEPVRRMAGRSTRLLISPDGELNVVPFAALVDGRNRFLVESYEIQYLTSGRDLLRFVKRPRSSKPAIFADPDFGDGRGYFAPLPGTAAEAKAIALLVPDALVLTGKGATESALKRVDAPEILHVATHGFFLGGESGSEAAVREIKHLDTGLGTGPYPDEFEPLIRSGIGLAEANLEHEAGDDGWLTALEATGLNLWGTQLVVLSACDTGVGEIKNGDGVYGLRRALVLAGAETTMMSLWPVSDEGTRDLMIRFYGKLLAGADRADALRQTQLEMLRDPGRRHPFYWAGFIQSGARGPVSPMKLTRGE